jgi:hypothetical protein
VVEVVVTESPPIEEESSIFLVANPKRGQKPQWVCQNPKSLCWHDFHKMEIRRKRVLAPGVAIAVPEMGGLKKLGEFMDVWWTERSS